MVHGQIQVKFCDQRRQKTRHQINNTSGGTTSNLTPVSTRSFSTMFLLGCPPHTLIRVRDLELNGQRLRQPVSSQSTCRLLCSLVDHTRARLTNLPREAIAMTPCGESTDKVYASSHQRPSETPSWPLAQVPLCRLGHSGPIAAQHRADTRRGAVMLRLI